jgi:hypothetical protein
MKPHEVTRAYTTSFDVKEQQLRAKSDRYQNKIRKGQNQVSFFNLLRLAYSNLLSIAS